MIDLKKLKSFKNEKDMLDFIENRLAYCIREGREINDGFEVIGEMLDINPSHSIEPIDYVNDGYDINIFWKQFIPPEVKIVFGIELQDYCHSGYYYYMNDFDYLFSFINFIKDKDVESEVDLIAYIHRFLIKYFIKPLEKNDRQKRFNLLCDIGGRYFKPIKEHSILDFKGQSTAMCTEFGAVGQNLLSFFGIETLYIHDKEHAYNIVEFSGNPITTSVVDFSQGVYSYDILKKTRTYLPFIGDIENCNDQVLQDLVSSDRRLQFHNYTLYTMGNCVLENVMSSTRSYGSAGTAIHDEKKLIK